MTYFNLRFSSFLVFFLSSFFVTAQSFELSVVNGYGSGIYKKGDTIHIWSKTSYPSKVFSHWNGEYSKYLQFDDEWHTVLIVPKTVNKVKITLTASFENASPDINRGELSLDLYGDSVGVSGLIQVDKEIHYIMPSDPKALVFLFHGTGGKAVSFLTRYERIQMISDLVHDGYGVILTESNETSIGNQGTSNDKIQWNTKNSFQANEENNIDILNTKLSLDSIIDLFDLSLDIPVFSIGMSNGAVFNDICASALGFKAGAHMTARGRYDTYTRDDILPIIWIMSDNDHQEHANNSTAYKHFQKMSESQIAEYHVFNRSPLYPERFMRNIGSINKSLAIKIYDRIVSVGLVGSDGYLSTFVLDTLSPKLFKGLGMTKVQKKEVVDELKCVNADHIMHSDYNKNIIRFFNQFLIPTSTKTTSIKDQLELTLYPNPVRDQLLIQNIGLEIINYIRIFDTNGKVVLMQETIDDNRIITNHLSSGAYIMFIQTNKNYYSRKFIKI